MKLISASNEYTAINLIKREPRYTVYRCQDRGGRRYLLYKFIKDELLESSLVIRFGELSSDFDGFSELFADSDDSLVLVFKDNELEQTFNDVLSAETSTVERLTALDRALEALCVHEVPADIACGLMESGNIGVKSDGSADCLYILDDISSFGKRGMPALSAIFANKLDQALSSRKRSPELAEFRESLESTPPSTMTELYDRFLSFSETQKRLTAQNSAKQKLKKAAAIGKTALTAVVLLVAAAILVISFLDIGKKPTQKLDRIGELIIEQTD